MINIWDYQDVERKVKITDVDGQEFIGYISDLVDVGEEAEGEGFGEDSISIDCQKGYIGIPQSKIKSIEILV